MSVPTLPLEPGVYISACPVAYEPYTAHVTVADEKEIWFKPVFAYIDAEYMVDFVKKSRRKYVGAVLMLSPELQLDKVREAIKEFADTNPILICPTVAEKLGIDTKSVYMYGSDEFWNLALGELIYFKGTTYKENIHNIIKVLGKGYVGLVRIVTSPFLGNFSRTFELYSKCFGLSEDYDEMFSTINSYIIRRIGSDWVKEPHGFEPDYALDIVAEKEKLSFLEGVEFDVTAEAVDEEARRDLEYLARWLPKSIAIQGNTIKIVGLL